MHLKAVDTLGREENADNVDGRADREKTNDQLDQLEDPDDQMKDAQPEDDQKDNQLEVDQLEANTENKSIADEEKPEANEVTNNLSPANRPEDANNVIVANGEVTSVREVDREVDRETERQTDRQTDREINQQCSSQLEN